MFVYVGLCFCVGFVVRLIVDCGFFEFYDVLCECVCFVWENVFNLIDVIRDILGFGDIRLIDFIIVYFYVVVDEVGL